jgi:hypothetical protein
MNRVKQWLHDTLGWAFSSGEHRDGVTICRYCQGRCTTDSNGDLFHLAARTGDSHER